MVADVARQSLLIAKQQDFVSKGPPSFLEAETTQSQQINISWQIIVDLVLDPEILQYMILQSICTSLTLCERRSHVNGIWPLAGSQKLEICICLLDDDPDVP